ncbi:short chain dehydrogenase [compost metagenome]
MVEPGPFRTDFLNEKTSVKFGEIEIDAYQAKSEEIRQSYVTGDQKQPGDPEKLAKALLNVMNDPNPPLRLLAGRRAVESVTQYLQNRLAEYEAWRELSLNMDFEQRNE